MRDKEYHDFVDTLFNNTVQTIEEPRLEYSSYFRPIINNDLPYQGSPASKLSRYVEVQHLQLIQNVITK